MEFIGATTFASDLVLSSFPLDYPEGTEPGDLLVATAVAPKHHPDFPWPTPAGWSFLQQSVHLGQFSTLAHEGEASVTFNVNPVLRVVKSTTAAVLAFRGATASVPVRKAGWPVCQNTGDSLCGGKWKGNVLSPCFGKGCVGWAAPPVTLFEPAMLLYAWSGHDAAEPMMLADDVVELASVQNQRMTLRLGTVPGGIGVALGSVAVPRPGSNWDHGIATVLAF